MKQIPQIQTYMTPMPHSIGNDIGLKKALEMMREYRIRHLPVQEEGRLIGILTDRDLKLASSFEGAYDLKVDEVMSPDPTLRFKTEKIELTPTLGHTFKITGNADIYYEQNDVQRLVIHTDQKIMGKNEFESSQIWSRDWQENPNDPQSPHLISFVYQLKGVPHKWFFVWTGISKDQGDNYEVTIYRANDILSNIQKIMNTLKFTAPGDWKRVGETLLKKEP